MENQFDGFYRCHRCRSCFVSLHDLAIHQTRGKCSPPNRTTDSLTVKAIEGLGWKWKGRMDFQEYGSELGQDDSATGKSRHEWL